MVGCFIGVLLKSDLTYSKQIGMAFPYSLLVPLNFILLGGERKTSVVRLWCHKPKNKLQICTGHANMPELSIGLRPVLFQPLLL